MTQAAARAELAELVQLDPEGARASVQISGSEKAGYTAEIAVRRGTSSGERTLRGARCDELAEAAVLIIAMAIDPEGASARAEQRARDKDALAQSAPSAAAGTRPSAERVGASAPTTEQPRATTTPETETPDTRGEPEGAEEPLDDEGHTDEEPEALRDPSAAGRLVLGVRGTGDAGSLPQPTIGGGLIAGIHWPRLRLELQAVAYVPQVVHTGPTASSSAKIHLLTAAINGCYDLLGTRDTQRALGGCAALEAGLSQGQARSISDGRTSQGLWLASFAGLDVRQRVLGPLHLRLLAEVGLPILRPSYEIAQFGRVFRASPVLARFGFSAFVLFP